MCLSMEVFGQALGVKVKCLDGGLTSHEDRRHCEEVKPTGLKQAVYICKYSNSMILHDFTVDMRVHDMYTCM